MALVTTEPLRAKAYRAGTLDERTAAVERVIVAMRRNLAAPLSLEEMAEIACLSSFHFNRVFRSVTGIPPGEFLAALRLDAAKRILLTTSLRVTDVCFELGYSSLGTFTTRFKQQVGLSPAQLRQLADDFTLSSVAPPFDRVTVAGDAPHPRESGGGGVYGSIAAPAPFAGLLFVGLFPKPIPQGRPVACVTLTAPGPFHIAPAPDGRYFALAAALPWSQSALSYLTPGAGLLVGVAERPSLVRDGHSSAAIHLDMRPLRATDPPILGVFPSLLRSAGAWRLRA